LGRQPSELGILTPNRGDSSKDAIRTEGDQMKYLLMIVGDRVAMSTPSPDPERQMKLYQALADELSSLGKFHEGAGLGPSSEARTLHRSDAGEFSVSEGPFSESGDVMGGYFVIEAESMDEAIEWAKKIPLRTAAKIEVREAPD